MNAKNESMAGMFSPLASFPSLSKAQSARESLIREGIAVLTNYDNQNQLMVQGSRRQNAQELLEVLGFSKFIT